ncbi:hypothetical protein M9458_028545, partial [Cirrhinus mrigala]
MTTTKLQTCQCRPTVQRVSRPSIPHCCLPSKTPVSMFTSTPLVRGCLRTLPSPRWYQTFTLPQPSTRVGRT